MCGDDAAFCEVTIFYYCCNNFKCHGRIKELFTSLTKKWYLIKNDAK